MLRLWSAGGRLLNCRPASLVLKKTPLGVGAGSRAGSIIRHYGRGGGGGKMGWGQTVRRWAGWALGGSAVAAAGTALVLRPGQPLREPAMGVRGAGCLERREERPGREAAAAAAAAGGARRQLGEREEAVRVAGELLQRVKDESGSPGIVAAVSVDGKLVWAEGIGFADVENRQPCTPDTVMRVASISKSFTMASVAKLWEQGRLDLDKPVQHYVPSFPKKEFGGEKVDISTRQLVSHLAGIRHYSKDYMKKLEHQPAKGAPAKAVTKDGSAGAPASTGGGEKCDSESREHAKKDGDFKEFLVTDNYESVVEALDMFKDDPLMHKPGSKFHYTTHGWTLVSAVVDAAAGRDFLDHMAALFRQLGMPHTVPDEAQPLVFNRARCYRRDKRGRLVNAPAVNLSHKWAGGGFLSDVRDLIQFGNAMLYSCQYTDAHRVAGLPPGYLKAETVEAVWCPVPRTKTWDKEGAYAMGWAVRDAAQSPGLCPERPRLVSHTGCAVGASSVLLVADRTEGVPPPSAPRTESGGDNHSSSSSNSPRAATDSGPASPLPRGIVVALIANMENVGLYKTAVDIAETFQKVDSPL